MTYLKDRRVSRRALLAGSGAAAAAWALRSGRFVAHDTTRRDLLHRPPRPLTAAATEAPADECVRPTEAAATKLAATEACRDCRPPTEAPQQGGPQPARNASRLRPLRSSGTRASPFSFTWENEPTSPSSSRSSATGDSLRVRSRSLRTASSTTTTAAS